MTMTLAHIRFIIVVMLLAAGWACFLRALGASRVAQRTTYGVLTWLHVAAILVVRLA